MKRLDRSVLDRAVDRTGASAMSTNALENDRHEMSNKARDEDHETEDETQRRKLGPRGVPGGADTSKMTPQQQKNIPKNIDPGHTA